MNKGRAKTITRLEDFNRIGKKDPTNTEQFSKRLEESRRREKLEKNINNRKKNIATTKQVPQEDSKMDTEEEIITTKTNSNDIKMNLLEYLKGVDYDVLFDLIKISWKDAKQVLLTQTNPDYKENIHYIDILETLIENWRPAPATYETLLSRPTIGIGIGIISIATTVLNSISQQPSQKPTSKTQ